MASTSTATSSSTFPTTTLPSSSAMSTTATSPPKTRDLSFLRALALQTKARRAQEADKAAANAAALAASTSSASSPSPLATNEPPTTSFLPVTERLQASPSVLSERLGAPQSAEGEESEREEGEISSSEDDDEGSAGVPFNSPPISLPPALPFTSTHRTANPSRSASPHPMSNLHAMVPPPRFPPPSAALLENLKASPAHRENKRPQSHIDGSRTERPNPIKQGAALLESGLAR